MTDGRCLLSGTLIGTNRGWVRIDDLLMTDEIINQYGKPVKIQKIGKWLVYWDNRRFCDRVYKIPRGFYGCNKDTYLTSFHKVDHGEMIESFKMGLELAKKDEISKYDRYIIYHVQIENSDKNKLVVNGGCIVESWY